MEIGGQSKMWCGDHLKSVGLALNSVADPFKKKKL